MTISILPTFLLVSCTKTEESAQSVLLNLKRALNNKNIELICKGDGYSAQKRNDIWYLEKQ